MFFVCEQHLIERLEHVRQLFGADGAAHRFGVFTDESEVEHVTSVPDLPARLEKSAVSRHPNPTGRGQRLVHTRAQRRYLHFVCPHHRGRHRKDIRDQWLGFGNVEVGVALRSVERYGREVGF